MSIYRGYEIRKNIKKEYIINSNIFNGSIVCNSFKTEEEAMNKIDSIERERVKRDQANIQRVDAQTKINS